MSRAKTSMSGKKRKKRTRGQEVLHNFMKNKGAVAGVIIIAVMLVIALSVDLLLDYNTQVINQDYTAMLQAPSLKHLMGTDHLGRDMFNRIIYGSRSSIFTGLAAVIVAVIISVPLGALSGYYGGWVDELIMRFTDVFTSIPGVLMAIVIVSALGTSLFNLVLAVGITAAPGFVRITRASVLTIRNQEFIESAKALGKRSGYIIMKHVLPNCLSPIIIQVTLYIASAVITTSNLSFLGLGLPEPAPEWGTLLSSGRNYIRGYGYLTVFPGLMILITVLGFNLAGDGLRDALDPKLKK